MLLWPEDWLVDRAGRARKAPGWRSFETGSPMTSQTKSPGTHKMFQELKDQYVNFTKYDHKL